jgi:hypothetical protein
MSDVTTTPVETPIDVAYPDSTDLHLRLSVGACRLKVRPGKRDTWITGLYTDPSGKLPCHVLEDGGSVRIKQGDNVLDYLNAIGKFPTFDLALGTGRPFRLTVEVGASENLFDLGGVPLTRLSFSTGAGKTELDFSAPNPESMTMLEIAAGAASLDVRNLANANFAEMKLEGGRRGGDYPGGDGSEDHARVDAGRAERRSRLRAPGRHPMVTGGDVRRHTRAYDQHQSRSRWIDAQDRVGSSCQPERRAQSPGRASVCRGFFHPGAGQESRCCRRWMKSTVLS